MARIAFRQPRHHLRAKSRPGVLDDIRPLDGATVQGDGLASHPIVAVCAAEVPALDHEERRPLAGGVCGSAEQAPLGVPRRPCAVAAVRIDVAPFVFDVRMQGTHTGVHVPVSADAGPPPLVSDAAERRGKLLRHSVDIQGDARRVATARASGRGGLGGENSAENADQ